jgi:hypothetical protein
MKRLALAVAIIVLLCGTAMAGRGTIQPSTSGRGMINGLADATSTGGAALANITDWTLGTGAELSNGVFQLQVGSGGWDADSLDMTALPDAGNWVKGGTEGASLIDNNTRLYLLDDSAGALVAYSLSDPYWTADLTGVGAGASFYWKLNAPYITDAAGSGALIIMGDNSTEFRISYSPSNDSRVIRDYSAATFSNSPDGGTYEQYTSIQNASMSTWIYNPHILSWVNAFKDIASGATSGDYMVFGCQSNPGIAINNWSYFNFKESYQETPYLTSTVQITMGERTISDTIDQIPIVEENGSNCTITWDYDITSGTWVTGKTLAQLQTALIGTSPSTLNLRANFASDGLSNCRFYFNSTNLTE